MGVTSAWPNAETSREFVGWLSTQDQEVLEAHVSCVLRHILHPQGVTNWAGDFTNIPSIPARGQDGICLVSLKTVRHNPVYLSDASDIQVDIGKAIVQRDSRVRLVVDHVPEVRRPISQRLRELGVRSLREALKEPERVVGSGDTTVVGEEISSRFRELRSPAFRRMFEKRLSKLGVEAELLRRDWHDRLSHVKTISVANSVSASYLLRNKSYVVETGAGFDSSSGIFWMRRDHCTNPSSLYETVAKQLVFKWEARPIELLALERAVTLEVTEQSFGRPIIEGRDFAESARPEDADGFEQEVEEHSELGEAVFGHSPWKPDEKRNTPTPGPIESQVARVGWRAAGRGGTARSDVGNDRSDPSPELEREHIESLKRQHYASHCQMCLCERSPKILAPNGSYIEWEEVRRRVVEAHHVDLKSAGGARHAGNLILLCKLHHDNFGRRLTSLAIVSALQNRSERHMIQFEVDTNVKGRKIQLEISDTGEIVRLFFTDYHANYWLEHGRLLN